MASLVNPVSSVSRERDGMTEQITSSTGMLMSIQDGFDEHDSDCN